MKKIKGLDTLRAFAVFFVIIEHFGVWFDETSFSGRMVRHVLIPDGGFGLDLFFVLSGFLITSILFNAKDSREHTSPFLIIKNFFIRRALRIFPIYYLLLFLLVKFNYPGIKDHLGYYATYTANILCFRTNAWTSFSHTWTLDVEEQFYLLWPWLVIFVKNKYFKYVAFAAIALGIASTYIAIVIQNRIGPFLVFNCIDAFGIGGLYAWARLEGAREKKFAKAVKIIAPGALAVYFGWKLSLFAGNPVLPFFFLTKTINSIIAVWLILLVVNNKSKLAGKYLLENRFLNFIGKISYGLYLYHYVYINGYFRYVNGFLYRITLPYPALNKTIHDRHYDYWIEVSIMVLISALSYILIEKPILNLKSRFNYNGK